MSSKDSTRLRMERDLYRRLLELGEHDDVAPFLEEALDVVVEAAGAARGVLGLRDQGDSLRFWLARGFSDSEFEAVRREISTGIIAEAIHTGQAISTASAVDDPRFDQQGSVQAQRIRAVLCVPVGQQPSRGVVYLQGREEPGPFSPDDRRLAEIFARHLCPLVDRLLRAPAAAPIDHTRDLRTKLAVAGLAGTSQRLADLFRQMLVAAPVGVSVLITGESGTGKTAVARAIHESSPRADRPFVELNCAAIPEPLFESELFGAEPGAHSTATRRIAGKADAADGGTLLLDEIGEMPVGVQSKLLGFLQSKSYYRLGAATPTKADVRIIAATNADLPARVGSGRFREDLFYRLSVLELTVPPLRERAEDIGPIADALIRSLGESQGQGLPLSRAGRLALAEAAWPGNIRQLDNVLQRGWATALAEGASAIGPQHLFPEQRTPDSDAGPETYQEAVRAFQARFVREALRACEWNVSATARQLDLSRSHLHDLIKALGLRRPDE